MDIFSLQDYCSRTKLWLVLYGRLHKPTVWRVPMKYGAYDLHKVLQWELSDEEWDVSDDYFRIKVDWEKKDFELIDIDIIDMELERINTLLQLNDIPIYGRYQLCHTRKLYKIVQSRWESKRVWRSWIHGCFNKYQSDFWGP